MRRVETTKVRFNDFQKQWKLLGPKLTTAFETVAQSGWYILGPQVKKFEAALASYWKIPFAVGVANGTDAIEIALRALNIKAGDEVLTTPMSAFATTLAIIKCGGIPVFIDTNERGLIDLDLAEAYFSKNPKSKFFIPVHLYGLSLDLEHLQRLQEKFSLKIVEDCAQSIGATWKGRFTGTVAPIASTSFYPTKNLGALGDAGAIMTSQKDLSDKCQALRNYGETGVKYHHDMIGLNSRLDEVQAALLSSALLPQLPEFIEHRKKTASKYLQGISNPNVTLIKVSEAESPCWHLFPVFVAPKNLDSLVKHLTNDGIESGRHYPRLIPHQKAIIDSKSFKVVGELQNSLRIANGEVSLPIHPFLDDSEVQHVIDSVNSWEPQ